MRGDMPFSRLWALPEKMISTRRISVPTPTPQQSCHDRWVTASRRMGKMREGKGRQPMVGSSRALQQSPSSENNYRQAFAKA
jgi:hypothetical protein